MLADVHHHLIYGVDDGPQTAEQMQQMLRALCDNGVAAVAATSHAEPGRHHFPMDTYRRHLQEARDWCSQEGLPLRILEGAEIFYTDDAARLLAEGQIPAIAGGRTVLVEFSPAAPYDHICGAVRKLGNAGYGVVIAHVERYQCLRNLAHITALREELGAELQINAGTVLNPGGFMTKRWLRKMLANGYCDLIATDAHNTSTRPCNLKACFELLAAEWGQETAQRLCAERPSQLLGLTE